MSRTNSPETAAKNLKVLITKEEMNEAKAYAKSHGMTFQWWVGHLIKNAIKESRDELKEVPKETRA